MYKDFNSIVLAAQKMPRKRVMAVAGAADAHVIDAVVHAAEMGIVTPVLVGDSAAIIDLLSQRAITPGTYRIVHCGKDDNPAEAAVALLRQGEADFLMKGMIDTHVLLQEVVRKENGLHTGRVMSHFALNQLPQFPKLIVNTDGGMIPYPSLEQKRQIIVNAVQTLRKLGNACPKVAILAAVEKVNPKMVETTDAYTLQEMNRNGEIPDCTVVGPISYDLAMDAEMAAIKKYNCADCGDFDILVAPNMAAGNILEKSWYITAGAKMAGIIVGAKIPIVLTSRGSSAEEKFLSIVLASMTAGEEDTSCSR